MSISFGDKALETLRSTITTVDRELAAGAPSDALRAAWSQLVTTLSLGAAPESRKCPHCGESGMRTASRCSKCWSALSPLPATVTDAAAAPVSAVTPAAEVIAAAAAPAAATADHAS